MKIEILTSYFFLRCTLNSFTYSNFDASISCPDFNYDIITLLKSWLKTFLLKVWFLTELSYFQCLVQIFVFSEKPEKMTWALILEGDVFSSFFQDYILNSLLYKCYSYSFITLSSNLTLIAKSKDGLSQVSWIQMSSGFCLKLVESFKLLSVCCYTAGIVK